MRVLLTGGAGYIGSRLTADLSTITDVDEIVLYDNLSRKNHNAFMVPPNVKGKVRFVEGELLDTRKLGKVMADMDVVVHLAAKVTTPFADQDPHLFEQVNHWGTAEVVYAAEKTSQLKRFVHVSSASVYGASSAEVAVGAPLHPRTFYGISKMRAEEHVKRLAEMMPATMVRCGNVYGYDRCMRFDTVINRFAFEAHFKGLIRVNGSGAQRRSFVHIGTVGKVLSDMVQGNVPSATYDLVENTWSVNDLAEVFMRIYPELDLLYKDQHMPMRELIVKRDERLVPSIEQTDLEAQVRELVERFAF